MIFFPFNHEIINSACLGISTQGIFNGNIFIESVFKIINHTVFIKKTLQVIFQNFKNIF